MMSWLLGAALVAYLLVLAVLCVYGLHRYALVMLFWRVRRRAARPPGRFDELPRVTVQLPMYNERHVARRIIEAAGRIDYPRDRLQIQVLDDSTDDTVEITRRTVERLAAAGLDIQLLTRADRVGYKAGALAAGLAQATGEFVAIFDADFVPPPDILRNAIDHFTDPRVGMVQCRWEHLNRESSVLTRAQAILLDGHFMIEHTARNRTGRWMSFNGTAGVWRRTAIEEAGGWDHDTLTEDLDLSYRAQLKGWRFVFLPQLAAPAELPPEMGAFKSQQHRWTKGGAQTCLKLLGRVLRSSAPWYAKLEAFFHLTSWVVYILMVLLTLLIGPAVYAQVTLYHPPSAGLWAVELLLLIVGTGSALAFYIASQFALRRGWAGTLASVPTLMAIGVGISLNNALAAIEGLLGRQSEFIRTPKFGDAAERRSGSWAERLAGFRGRGVWQAWAEVLLAAYLMYFTVLVMSQMQLLDRAWGVLPFMLMFVGGYFYVGVETLRSFGPVRRPATKTATAVA